MPEKIIRDPVHDVIAFRLEKPIDALLFRLLNAVEFQRLRRIHQLGMTSLAYPGADHSRYSHSLGVMETARRILNQLRRSFPIDEHSEAVCLAAALLHDLGHGPFSHVFERVSGIDHELLTQRVIADPESDVHRLLFQFDRLMPEAVQNLLRGPADSFFHDILCSQVDADRLDYLLRDNLMTGSRYGDYDLNWLLHAFTLDPTGKRLAISWKGVSAVEAYLQARYHMYRNVYFHKVVRAAEGMIKLALQRAKRLAVQDRLEWPQRDGNVYKALTGQRLTMAEFTDLDDVSIWQCLKIWTNCDDPVLARLCRGLVFRKVYKTIDLGNRFDAEQSRQAWQRARQAVVKQGGDGDYDLFYDEASDTPYETVNQSVPDSGQPPSGEILVIDPAGAARCLGHVSPLIQTLNRELMFRRIHVCPEFKKVILDVM